MNTIQQTVHIPADHRLRLDLTLPDDFLSSVSSVEKCQSTDLASVFRYILNLLKHITFIVFVILKNITMLSQH
jgi:hypothetical protein